MISQIKIRILNLVIPLKMGVIAIPFKVFFVALDFAVSIEGTQLPNDTKLIQKHTPKNTISQIC